MSTTVHATTIIHFRYLNKLLRRSDNNINITCRVIDSNKVYCGLIKLNGRFTGMLTGNKTSEEVSLEAPEASDLFIGG